MPNTAEISAQLEGTLLAAVNEIIARLPGIAGALLLLIVGWFVARAIRLAALKLLNLFNHFMERALSGRTRAMVHFSTGIANLIAGILFWVILFIFVTAALNTAGLTGMAAWLERIVDFLPAILTGCFIILVGYILSAVVKDLSLAAAQAAEIADAVVISRLAQAATLVTAVIIGLEQIGLNVSFITTILGVSIAALLAGFALAFGLGARTLVSNLIASHHLRELVDPGQTVRIGEWEGTVLELSATGIILDTAQGRASVPANLYQEQGLLVLLADSDDE